MEYLSDWPFQGTFLETPLWYLIGRELKAPTVQGTIPSYRRYRRDTPPSIDRGIRASEGDRGGRTELVHSRAVYFSRFDESRPSQKRQNLPSLQVNSRKESDLAVSPQARTRYGI